MLDPSNSGRTGLRGGHWNDEEAELRGCGGGVGVRAHPSHPSLVYQTPYTPGRAIDRRTRLS
jgi:hypothetical protein